MIFRLLLFLPCLLLSLAATAQIEFGLKAGLATSSLQGERFDLSVEGRENLRLALEEGGYGFQFGAFARLPLSDRFAIQPEITFNSMNADYRLDSEDGSVMTEVFEETYNDVNIPVLGSWKLAFLRLNAGPVGHFTVNSKSDLLDADGRERSFDDFTLGYALGVAADIGPLTLDVRYDGNFAKYGNEFSVLGETFEVDQAPRRWVASVGYRF